MENDQEVVASIADGLSVGQRAVLLETLPDTPRLYIAAPGIPRVALFGKRLLSSYGGVEGDVDGLRFALTPLGERVRTHLLANTGDL